jgi:hypothetical protein
MSNKTRCAELPISWTTRKLNLATSMETRRQGELIIVAICVKMAVRAEPLSSWQKYVYSYYPSIETTLTKLPHISAGAFSS